MLDHIVPTLVQILFFPFSVMVFGRLDRATATAAVVLSGLLFLPEITIFKIADAVPIDKDRIIYLGALFGMLVHQDRAFLASRPVMSIAAVLIPMMISNVLTWQANLDPLFSQGDLHIGLSYSWLIGESIDNFFKFALPFVIAKAAFVSYQDLRSLFYLLIGMAVFYTALILFEVAMAIPFHVFQIHERLYGISFRPLFRLGFTEPAVFLGSGHIVATFMAMAVIASTGLKKIGKPFAWLRVNKARVITSVGLLATFKVGAAFLGFGAVIIITVFKPRRIALIASFSALMICIYPAMQAYDLFPEDVLIELAKEYTNADRAKSFGGRFDEEEHVLDVLDERLLVGFGHFGRIPGADLKISGSGEAGLDAWWVIKTGSSGVIGMELAFLLMAIPVWKARKRIASIQSDETILLLGALMMCVVVRMTDLMLNGWWNSFPIFLAGALYGICKQAHLMSDETTNSDDEPQKKRNQQYAGDA